jgi:hypothetical protein
MKAGCIPDEVNSLSKGTQTQQRAGNPMKHSYATAKLVIGILEILGWSVFCLGVIGGVYYYKFHGNLAVLGGLAVSASGLLEVVAGQMAMAQIATAENTRAMLELMQRDKAIERTSKRVEPPVTQPEPVLRD